MRDTGSGIRDTGSGIRDTGYAIFRISKHLFCTGYPVSRILYLTSRIANLHTLPFEISKIKLKLTRHHFLQELRVGIDIFIAFEHFQVLFGND